MKKKKLRILIVLLIVVAVGILAYILISNYIYKTDLVYSEVYLEAGSETPPVSEFLKREAEGANFSEGTIIDTYAPGDYELTIEWEAPIYGLQTYTTTLHIQDTTAPGIKASQTELFLYTVSDAPTAESLIDSVVDATDCTIEYEEEYDFSTPGEFDVEIVVTDTSGNQSSVCIPCTVVEDTTAPTISGVEPLEIAMGDPVTYKKNVTVTDDYDENPTLEVDSDGVNLDKRGTYYITYIATDAVGNVSKKTTSVKIVSSKIAAATEDTVNAMADEILATIITDGMTQLQQARAVFDWVVENITYSETAGMDDLLSAAYKGMYYRVGDCTVKQKTAEVMLNRLGIKNMEIEKIRDTRGHYWLLIDVGEGWYHYDPNMQLDGTLIFYWHDADLWAYSNAHKNTHNYDPSKYPTIQ